jgi:DNA-binding beta-propeller fold protein YncE
MIVRKLGHRCQSLRNWLIFLVAALLSVHAMVQAADGIANNLPLLNPWVTLAGARITARPNPLSALPRMPAFTGYLPWLSPSVVAARGNFVYVVDDGRRQIFLYDLAQQTMSPFAAYSAGAVTGITIAPDMSLYVADINARQVLHFSVDGRLLQRFGNDMEVARPVSVLLDEPSGNILVADSLYNHVVVFNSLGRVLSVLQSSEGRSIEAMARGPDGLYLVDRLSKQVVVIGQDGADRYILGNGTLKNPGAIAVDRFNRVFVSDSFDNTIKIYEHGQLAASFGGSGATPASFNRITSLWLEQNMLYVADSLNARIQTFRVTAQGVKERPHD